METNPDPLKDSRIRELKRRSVGVTGWACYAELTSLIQKGYNITLWYNYAIEVITMKLKLLLISLVLGFSIFYSAICPQLCPSDQDSLGFVLNANCLILVFIMAGLSMLSSLLLIGLITFKNIHSTHKEFLPSLFRPPRLPA